MEFWGYWGIRRLKTSKKWSLDEILELGTLLALLKVQMIIRTESFTASDTL